MAHPKHTLALVPDLFAASRMDEAAKRAGLPLRLVDSPGELEALLPEASLLVIDVGTEGLDLAAIVSAARAHGVPVIAFGPHQDLERIRAAHAAGLTRFYPRGRFLEEFIPLLQQALSGATR
jgi:DNA-binding NtrC family response regulator